MKQLDTLIGKPHGTTRQAATRTTRPCPVTDHGKAGLEHPRYTIR
ncbi:hypothetical protein [Pseudoduganella albidiflava]|nr:hypothetical protein [Pseudoduganella albidiflava]